MPIGILLQFPLYHRLSYSVCNCRNTQKPFGPIFLGYCCLSYCFGKIATACHPVPYRVKVFPWIARYGINGYSINTGTFAIGSHFFESLPNFPSLDRLRLLLLFKNHTRNFKLLYKKKRLHVKPFAPLPFPGLSALLRLHPSLMRNIGILDLPFGLSSVFLGISSQVLLFLK